MPASAPRSCRTLRLRAGLALLIAALGLAATEDGAAEPTPAVLASLGKQIFEDTTLSRPAGVSCASCHNPATAFQGHNGSSVPAFPRGAQPGTVGARNTPSILYASFTPPFAFVDDTDPETGETSKIPLGGQFLDGRADSLAAQVEGPLLNPREMNGGSKREIVAAARRGPYAQQMRAIWGDDIFNDDNRAFAALATALAAFEASPVFRPFASRFDDYLRGNGSLTARELEGFELFKDPEKGNCLACHVGKVESREPADWLFTDFTYDALGAPPHPAADGAPDLGLCQQPGLAERAPPEVDLERLCGAFKVPSLRNVAVTGPWLHNGSIDTLREVVAFYATRDVEPARWYPVVAGEVRKFGDLPARYHPNVNADEPPYDRKPGETARLTPSEIDAITAFLETLTDRPAALAQGQAPAAGHAPGPP